jgi:hypothetical protein
MAGLLEPLAVKGAFYKDLAKKYHPLSPGEGVSFDYFDNLIKTGLAGRNPIRFPASLHPAHLRLTDSQ